MKSCFLLPLYVHFFILNNVVAKVFRALIDAITIVIIQPRDYRLFYSDPVYRKIVFPQSA